MGAVTANDEPRSPERTCRAMNGAQRRKRVFSIDVTTCVHCGDGVRIVASVEEPTAIRFDAATPRRAALGPPLGRGENDLRTTRMRGPFLPKSHAQPPDPSPNQRLRDRPPPRQTARKGRLNFLYPDLYPDRDAAIQAAYASGAYTLKVIAVYFGLHYATVSRIARKAIS